MDSKTPAVLIVCPFFRPNIGGAETHLDDLCEYLTRRGQKVYVITYQPLTTNVRGPALERSENLEIRRISWIGLNLFNILEPYPALEIFYLAPLLFIHTIKFMIKKHKEIDVIHAHGLNAAFIAAVCRMIFNKRAVVSIHAIYNLTARGFMRFIIRAVLKRCDHVMCLGEKSRKEFVNIGLEPSRVSIYRQWVKQGEIFRALDKKEARGLLGLHGDFIVLFVGRFIAIKGVRAMIEAAANFPEGVKFVFVGDGPLRSDVEAAAENSKNIVYAGKKSQMETALYYAASDVFVIPSQYEEGFARVVLEALSCGTPLIAADKGCLREMLDKSVAVLIEPSVSGIAEAIRALINDKKRLMDMTANARPYAEKYFSEKNAETVISKYYENSSYKSP